MEFKTALSHYKDGTATEEERGYIEKELEKAQLIAQCMDVPWDNPPMTEEVSGLELKRIRRKWDTAVLIGEFNNFEQEAFACAKYARNDISYVKWTYKTMNTGSGWGIFNADAGHIDLNYASYEEVLEFFNTKLSTEDYKFNETEMHFILP